MKRFDFFARVATGAAVAVLPMVTRLAPGALNLGAVEMHAATLGEVGVGEFAPLAAEVSGFTAVGVVQNLAAAELGIKP